MIKEMTRLLTITLLLLCFTGGIDAQSAEVEPGQEAQPWLLSITTNTVSWDSSDVDNSGSQVVGYFQIAYESNNWGVAVTGKAAKTSYETTLDEGKLEISSLTDTSVSTFYNYSREALTMRGGVDVSVPTGKNSYSDDELSKIITDTISSDLMLLTSYGAGTNIIPHLMAVYQATEQLTLGVGARYEFAGEYDPSSDIPDDNIDPGDKFFAMINGAYRVVDEDYFILTITYNQTGSDTISGDELFQTGDTFSFETRYIRKWNESLSSIFSANIRRQNKNKAVDASDVLNAELSNSNNNSWEIFANNIYRHSSKLWLTGMLGYKAVGSNGYNLGDELYDGGRAKFYIEPGLSWYFRKGMYMTANLRYSKIADKQDAFSATDADYNLFNIDLGLVYGF